MDLEWIQLDGWNRPTGRTFSGSYGDLATHLVQHLRGVGTVTHGVEVLILRVEPHIHEKIRTSVALLTTPWGHHRWIPNPGR